jgi:hypothetical protein
METLLELVALSQDTLPYLPATSYHLLSKKYLPGKITNE